MGGLTNITQPPISPRPEQIATNGQSLNYGCHGFRYVSGFHRNIVLETDLDCLGFENDASVEAPTQTDGSPLGFAMALFTNGLERFTNGKLPWEG